jgi:Tfp pilus assembly protein PilO
MNLDNFSNQKQNMDTATMCLYQQYNNDTEITGLYQQ